MKSYAFAAVMQTLLVFTIVGLSPISVTQIAAQTYTTVSKSCGSCNLPVPITSSIGDYCPHCHVRWGYENQTTIPGTRTFAQPAQVEPELSQEERHAQEVASVRRESDQLVLAKLAIEDKDSDIRKTAAERLTEELPLRKVVMEAKDAEVRLIVIGKLEDQTVLANVAKNDPDAGVRQAAMSRQSADFKTIDLGNGVMLEMVWIPPGEFLMGSPDGETCRQDDEVQHVVKVAQGFWIGKYEVTQEQWEQVMGNNPSKFKGPKNPVEQVSWDDCQKYLKKLNQKTSGRNEGRNGSCGNFRLPSEAEEEYSCRGGTITKFYSGGTDSALDQVGWYEQNSGGQTHPVGQKAPNQFGLFDMHGNVSEWCQGWKEAHSAESVTDSSSNSIRVIRGGSWISYAYGCRAAFRIDDVPYGVNGTIGFRAVLTQGL